MHGPVRRTGHGRAEETGSPGQIVRREIRELAFVTADVPIRAGHWKFMSSHKSASSCNISRVIVYIHVHVRGELRSLSSGRNRVRRLLM